MENEGLRMGIVYKSKKKEKKNREEGLVRREKEGKVSE